MKSSAQAASARRALAAREATNDARRAVASEGEERGGPLGRAGEGRERGGGPVGVDARAAAEEAAREPHREAGEAHVAGHEEADRVPHGAVAVLLEGRDRGLAAGRDERG